VYSLYFESNPSPPPSLPPLPYLIINTASILFSQEKRFRLVDIPGAGRGLISTSLIQPGDIILRDKPVILGEIFICY